MRFQKSGSASTPSLQSLTAQVSPDTQRIHRYLPVRNRISPRRARSKFEALRKNKRGEKEKKRENQNQTHIIHQRKAHFFLRMPEPGGGEGVVERESFHVHVLSVQARFRVREGKTGRPKIQGAFFFFFSYTQTHPSFETKEKPTFLKPTPTGVHLRVHVRMSILAVSKYPGIFFFPLASGACS